MVLDLHMPGMGQMDLFALLWNKGAGLKNKL